jgi:hypothetical protein
MSGDIKVSGSGEQEEFGNESDADTEPGADIDDVDERDDTVVQLRYDVASYGIDFDVNGVVQRLKKGAITVPDFQRSYVWSMKDASRFIESLLLGLPVPGVFLAKDPETAEMLVIDGQQRLKSLLFFYDGYFNPRVESPSRRVFRLKGVQRRFEGLTYEQLDERDRRELDDAVLHATVVKQESPPGDDTSIYHVYERLNSGGRKLQPQEIRSAIYHGSFIDLLKALNDNANWRALYGARSKRLKDQEMILRFLAFLYHDEEYSRPMAEFLNVFAKRNRNPDQERLDEFSEIFTQTMSVLKDAVGPSAFRPERNFNAAAFDSVSVGLARRLTSGDKVESAAVKKALESFVADPGYLDAVLRSTADEALVERRIARATTAFASI